MLSRTLTRPLNPSPHAIPNKESPLVRSWMTMVFLSVVGSATAADYYVDPLIGSISNIGSATSPWSTLSAVAQSKQFQPGDRIYLRRGYHGDIFITGQNTADVFILPEPGHTPCARVLTLYNASHWNIRGLTISGAVVPIGHPDRSVTLPSTQQRMINIDTQDNEGSHFNTISDCYGYTAQVEQTVAWNHNNWAVARGTAQNYGHNNTIRGCHWYNTKGAMLNGFHSNYFTYSRNVHENFAWDAIQQKADYGLFEYNLVMNYYIIDGNHNDGFQSYGGAPRTGTVLRGNTFIAFSDINQPFRYGSASARGSYCNGIGMWDGYYDDWIIENNVIFNDNYAGIGVLGARRLKIVNNTVAPCTSSGRPSLYVNARKNGDPSIDVTNANNLVVRGTGTGIFLDWAKKDVRLKSGAIRIDAAAYSAATAASVDADGNPRPFNNRIDTGAYEYGYITTNDTTAPSIPTNVRATIIPGYGVDIRWSPSTDNRTVAGYDIFRDGVRIGHKRAGTTFFHPSVDTTGAFTVKSFDLLGNLSSASANAIIDGTTPIPVNVAPVAQSSNISVAYNTPRALTLLATDADGNALTYQIITGPSKGTLSGTAPALTYTPSAGATGSDTISFRANDGITASNTATVSITIADAPLPINTAPIAQSTSISVPYNTPKSFNLLATDADSNALTYLIITGPSKGVLSGTAPALIYTPSAGATGSDTITYRANDGSAVSNTATVSITIANAPTPPQASVVYQAEDATIFEAKAYGTYVDYINASGDYIEWTVNAPSAGNYLLTFTYALSSGNRPLAIAINGTVVNAALSFPSTGSSSSYKTVTVPVTLPVGSSKVRATAIGASGANMDSLTVSPAPAIPTASG